MNIRFLLPLLVGAAALGGVPAASHYIASQDQDSDEDESDESDNAAPENDESDAPEDDAAVADDGAADDSSADDANDADEADDGDDQASEANEDEAGEQSEEVVNAEPVEPTPEILLLWADPPRDEYEVEATQIYNIFYFDRCSNRRYCEETRKIVSADLASLLIDYLAYSLSSRRNDTPSVADISSATSYRVDAGQKIELKTGKPGVNDAELWGQITRLMPLEQSDRLMGQFQVFSKPKSNTIAYMGRDDTTGRFTMGINDPVHLATDVQEQKLTIAHEFMHMIVVAEAIPMTEGQACVGIAYPDDGCYKPGSIYADFVKRFWSEADRDAAAKGGDVRSGKENSFVTAYAATNPHEDIAESFSVWVLSEGKGKTLADSKQRFFNGYPNLVALKQHIRTSLIGQILKERRRVAPRNTAPRK